MRISSIDSTNTESRSDKQIDELKQQFQLFRETFARLENEIGRIVVGQSRVIRETLIALISGGHVLLEGVPGLGKTLLVRTLSAVIAGKFSRIQFTPDLMPADLTGTNILTEDDSGRRRFEFQRGPLFANIVLADEINRATPKTQAALLEAMQEHSVTHAGITHPISEPFFVLATQNPLEMEGTYPLPEAQIDRFFGKILVPFPSQKELLSILERTTGELEASVSPVCTSAEILEMGKLARQIHVTEEVSKMAVRLCLGTHPHSELTTSLVQKYVKFGASPRGAQSLLLGAKISAILDERFHVSRDDLHELAPMVFRHRIILNFEGEADRINADDIIFELCRLKD
ncbi:MAG: AAA family ATPase [Thermoguttaceae bacterium]